jgi:hypothetical protein
MRYKQMEPEGDYTRRWTGDYGHRYIRFIGLAAALGAQQKLTAQGRMV